MACYSPLVGYRTAQKNCNGKYPITFDESEGVGMRILIPCGKCIGCRLDYSRQWAVRCVNEASLYDDNCFITLTYNDDHLPSGGSLCKRDFQLFMKRLRRRFVDRKIRYFMCGEYGSKGDRPHFHACLFNVCFNDKVVLEDVNGQTYYTSRLLQDLWCDDNGVAIGFVQVGEVSFRSAAYIARYVIKKVGGRPRGAPKESRRAEYAEMSRRPGLGKEFYERFRDDIYNSDFLVTDVGIKGIKCKPPAYYDKIFDRIQDDYSLDTIKYNRKKEALNNPDFNNPRRLQVKETIQYIKADKLVRPLD